MEMNDRDKNIVNLINQLAEYADDETTTQEAMDGILEKIKDSTNETIKREMKEADQFEYVPPREDVERKRRSEELNNSIMQEKMKLIEQLKRSQEQACESARCIEEETKAMKMSNKMLFTRIREVKKPGKAHPTDAGIDFYVPDEKAWDEEFKDMVIKYSRNSEGNAIEFTDKGMTVPPNAHVAIPSGIKTIIPQGLGMMFVNKSGVATKMKLDHSACLVDSEYRDEIVMCFFNHNTEPVIIEPGTKITQGLIVPIINLEMNEVLNCVYEDMGKDTDRGGGFGSSGTK